MIYKFGHAQPTFGHAEQTCAHTTALFTSILYSIYMHMYCSEKQDIKCCFIFCMCRKAVRDAITVFIAVYYVCMYLHIFLATSLYLSQFSISSDFIMCIALSQRLPPCVMFWIQLNLHDMVLQNLQRCQPRQDEQKSKSTFLVIKLPMVCKHPLSTLLLHS